MAVWPTGRAAILLLYSYIVPDDGGRGCLAIDAD